MKIHYLILSLMFFHSVLPAQSLSEITNEFKVSGKVKSEKTFTVSDLMKFKTVELKNVNTSCSPKKEDIVKSVKAVLLKDILDSVSFQYEKSYLLNEYYFLFVAADGYKVVFSFNEIYNTEIGNNLYVVTELEGKPISEMENRILILTTKDIKAGPRNMKWLSEIVVCRAG